MSAHLKVFLFIGLPLALVMSYAMATDRQLQEFRDEVRQAARAVRRALRRLVRR